MRTITRLSVLVIIITIETALTSLAQDKVQAFKELMQSQLANSQSVFFQRHYQGFLDVIESRGTLTTTEESFIGATYDAFNDASLDLKNEATYLDRKFPLVFAWVSPTDGNVSYTRVRLPKDWDPNKEYPLYLQLHGLWSVAASAIDFMTYSFRNNPASSYAFEDGYVLDPWGRGNLWYKEISETDIWECIAAFEEIAKIDQSRKYLTGHSMGGFGTWYIASKSVNVWAAIGLHAAALQYDNTVLSDDVIASFKNLPVYFVCGTNDGLISINTNTFERLVEAGIENVEFTTFTGGHEFVQTNVENMYDWIRNFQNLNTTLPEVHNLKLRANFDMKENNLNFIVQSPASSRVEISVFDITGKKIKSEERIISGLNPIVFKMNSSNIKSGIYIYRVKTNEDQITGKFVIK